MRIYIEKRDVYQLGVGGQIKNNRFVPRKAEKSMLPLLKIGKLSAQANSSVQLE